MITHRDTIRGKGLRITPARLAVFSILSDSEKPLDISNIIAQISKRHVDADQATIYRIIDNFMKKDLITKLQFQERKFYYEVKGEEHHHAICTKCGRIEDISTCNIKRLEREIEKDKGFTVSQHSLEFYGVCSRCR